MEEEIEVVPTQKNGDVAYTVKDKHFGDFDVLFSFNAWWVDRGKVDAIIQAFKIDATIEEACVYAGITLYQYKYFLEIHPGFSALRKACKNLPVLKARQTVVKSLDDPEMALKYLERKKKDEFSPKQEIDHKIEGNILLIQNGNNDTTITKQSLEIAESIQDKKQEQAISIDGAQADAEGLPSQEN